MNKLEVLFSNISPLHSNEEDAKSRIPIDCVPLKLYFNVKFLFI